MTSNGMGAFVFFLLAALAAGAFAVIGLSVAAARSSAARSTPLRRVLLFSALLVAAFGGLNMAMELGRELGVICAVLACVAAVSAGRVALFARRAGEGVTAIAAVLVLLVAGELWVYHLELGYWLERRGTRPAEIEEDAEEGDYELAEETLEDDES